MDARTRRICGNELEQYFCIFNGNEHILDLIFCNMTNNISVIGKNINLTPAVLRISNYQNIKLSASDKDIADSGIITLLEV